VYFSNNIVAFATGDSIEPDAVELIQVLADNPTLTSMGWWSRRTEDHYPGRLRAIRRESLQAPAIGQFLRAREFLRLAPRGRTMNWRHCAYTLKCVAEIWYDREHPGSADEDVCISEGMFVAACIAHGVRMVRQPCGTYTDLSHSLWEKGMGRR
jgi:hypothetical protein